MENFVKNIVFCPFVFVYVETCGKTFAWYEHIEHTE